MWLLTMSCGAAADGGGGRGGGGFGGGGGGFGAAPSYGGGGGYGAPAAAGYGGAGGGYSNGCKLRQPALWLHPVGHLCPLFSAAASAAQLLQAYVASCCSVKVLM